MRKILKKRNIKRVNRFRHLLRFFYLQDKPLVDLSETPLWLEQDMEAVLNPSVGKFIARPRYPSPFSWRRNGKIETALKEGNWTKPSFYLEKGSIVIGGGNRIKLTVYWQTFFIKASSNHRYLAYDRLVIVRDITAKLFNQRLIKKKNKELYETNNEETKTR